MAIRRFTYEIDDGDAVGATGLPAEIQLSHVEDLKTRSLTSVETPVEQTLTDEDSGSIALPTTGRTFPDLFVEFVNQPRAIVVLFLFASCAIFVTKISSVRDLGVPLTLGLVLNAAWFGIGAISKWLHSRKGT